MSTRLAVLAALLAACADRPRPAQTAVAPPAAAVSQSPGDSLVLSLERGASIWLTEERIGHDSAGTACSERSVEIRRDSTRIRVPLLYTRSPVKPAGTGFVLAVLSTSCRPLAEYRVDLATGRPIKVRDR
ncbi:MAG: hypothetical protein ABI647_03655 [Gemmatimonadota bacterium]